MSKWTWNNERSEFYLDGVGHTPHWLSDEGRLHGCDGGCAGPEFPGRRPQEHDIALCGKGRPGLIVSATRRLVTYPDGGCRMAYTGVGLLDGLPWSSGNPCIVGTLDDWHAEETGLDNYLEFRQVEGWPRGWETQQTIARWGEQVFGGRGVDVYQITDFSGQRNAVEWFRKKIQKLRERLRGAGAGRQLTVATRALEEFGELLEAIVDECDPEVLTESRALAGEYADVRVILEQAARMGGVDSLRAVAEKMQVNRARRWDVTGPGVGQHIEE